MYKLKVPHEITEFIGNMHPHLKKKVGASMQVIISEPYSGKALKDELEGLWSFRVGRFRIIYGIAAANKQIEIVAVGPRNLIYEEILRLVRKS